MRSPVLAFAVAAAAFCCEHVSGFSVQRTLTKSKMSSTSLEVRREPIKMPSQTPMFPWKAPGSDYAQFIDMYSAMYRDRTMLIGKYIDEEAANEIISIILYLRKEDPKGPISLYFNVPGAVLRPALAVYDVLLQTRDMCEISTVNLGLCTGMGSLLCGAGTKGKRSAMPNSRFLLSRTGMDRPFQGQASDIALEVRSVKTLNEKMEEELSKMTGQPIGKIQQDLKRDFYLSSDEAVQYGLIDQVLLPTPNKRAARGQAVDLGSFEGEGGQRYQNQPQGQGGWGSRQQSVPEKKKKDDDDEPEVFKG